MSFRCVNTLRHSLPVLLTSDFLVGLLAFCIFNGSFQVSACTCGCVLLGLRCRVGRTVEPVCRRVQVYLAARVCCPKHGRRRCAWCMSQLDVRVPMRKRAPPVGEPLGKPKQPHGGFATVIVLVCGLVVVLLEVVGALVTGQCDVVALADWQAQCDGLEADGGCAPRGYGVAATA